jgi:hypothetical protein
MRRAWFYALLPIIGGSATLLLWMLTREPMLITVGMVFLVLMPVSVLLGMRAIRLDEVNPRPQLWAMGLLLLANFPIAAAEIYVADHFYSSFTALIVNRSSEPLHNLYIVAGSDTASGARLDPGESFRVRLHPHGNTRPLVSCRDSSGERTMVIDHYLTGIDDGHMTVSVLDESYEVEIRPIALRLFETL